jgi:hypothetical protein
MTDYTPTFPDDTDWEYEKDKLTPPPNEIDPVSGKKMWVIKHYKIWADSYEQALQLLPMMEGLD